MTVPELQALVFLRLCHGPATECSLARRCDIHIGAARALLARMVNRQQIRRLHSRYTLPFNPLSPAGAIVVPQYRWGSTRLS